MKLGQIKDVRVPVEVVLGGNTVSVEQLGTLGEGTIIELTKLAGEPVDVRAGGELVGYGEVVVIDENFGVRVTQLVGDREV
ncbi:MAG: FliM/FliN family flagellar motor switch protein [bacterium]